MNTPATFYYAAVGPRLTAHRISFDPPSLSRDKTVSLPANVQYAWPHPTLPVLYVVSSDGGPYGTGTMHHATAFEVDTASGALTPFGDPVALPSRPIHCTVDNNGDYLLTAYNAPSNLTVHEIGQGGALGAAVEQISTLNCGIYGHQVMVTPTNTGVIAVARGNDAAPPRPEDPGALNQFAFSGGQLRPRGDVFAGERGGLGFGPRHLAFHPGGQWAAVSIERQDELQIFALGKGDLLGAKPTHTCSSLKTPHTGASREQLGGTVRFHPSGKYLYQANRRDGLERDDGWPVAQPGEDSLVVYAFDERTGEPTIVQRVHTPSVHVRTLSLDPSGRLLIAATIQPIPTRDDDGNVRLVPAAIMLYTVHDDGTLALARTYEVHTGDRLMFWTGITTFGPTSS